MSGIVKFIFFIKKSVLKLALIWFVSCWIVSMAAANTSIPICAQRIQQEETLTLYAFDKYDHSETYVKLYDGETTIGEGHPLTHGSVDPRFVRLCSGDFVAVWTRAEHGVHENYIHMVRLNEKGNILTKESRVAPNITAYQDGPHVAALETGGYVITWQQAGHQGSHIFGRVYNNDDKPLNDVIQISMGPHVNVNADVKALPGGFVVVWWQRLPAGLFFRIFDNAGRPKTKSTLVAKQTEHDVPRKIRVLADASFIIYWADFFAQDEKIKYGRYFDAKGKPLTDMYCTNGVDDLSELKSGKYRKRCSSD